MGKPNITSSIRLFADDCVLYRQVSSDGDCKALSDDLCRLTEVLGTEVTDVIQHEEVLLHAHWSYDYAHH